MPAAAAITSAWRLHTLDVPPPAVSKAALLAAQRLGDNGAAEPLGALLGALPELADRLYPHDPACPGDVSAAVLLPAMLQALEAPVLSDLPINRTQVLQRAHAVLVRAALRAGMPVVQAALLGGLASCDEDALLAVRALWHQAAVHCAGWAASAAAACISQALAVLAVASCSEPPAGQPPAVVQHSFDATLWHLGVAAGRHARTATAGMIRIAGLLRVAQASGATHAVRALSAMGAGCATAYLVAHQAACSPQPAVQLALAASSMCAAARHDQAPLSLHLLRGASLVVLAADSASRVHLAALAKAWRHVLSTVLASSVPDLLGELASERALGVVRVFASLWHAPAPVPGEVQTPPLVTIAYAGQHACAPCLGAAAAGARSAWQVQLARQDVPLLLLQCAVQPVLPMLQPAVRTARVLLSCWTWLAASACWLHCVQAASIVRAAVRCRGLGMALRLSAVPLCAPSLYSMLRLYVDDGDALAQCQELGVMLSEQHGWIAVQQVAHSEPVPYPATAILRDVSASLEWDAPGLAAALGDVACNVETPGPSWSLRGIAAALRTPLHRAAALASEHVRMAVAGQRVPQHQHQHQHPHRQPDPAHPVSAAVPLAQVLPEASATSSAEPTAPKPALRITISQAIQNASKVLPSPVEAASVLSRAMSSARALLGARTSSGGTPARSGSGAAHMGAALRMDTRVAMLPNQQGIEAVFLAVLAAPDAAQLAILVELLHLAAGCAWNAQLMCQAGVPDVLLQLLPMCSSSLLPVCAQLLACLLRLQCTVHQFQALCAVAVVPTAASVAARPLAKARWAARQRKAARLRAATEAAALADRDHIVHSPDSDTGSGELQCGPGHPQTFDEELQAVLAAQRGSLCDVRELQQQVLYVLGSLSEVRVPSTAWLHLQDSQQCPGLASMSLVPAPGAPGSRKFSWADGAAIACWIQVHWHSSPATAVLTVQAPNGGKLQLILVTQQRAAARDEHGMAHDQRMYLACVLTMPCGQLKAQHVLDGWAWGEGDAWHHLALDLRQDSAAPACLTLSYWIDGDQKQARVQWRPEPETAPEEAADDRSSPGLISLDRQGRQLSASESLANLMTPGPGVPGAAAPLVRVGDILDGQAWAETHVAVGASGSLRVNHGLGLANAMVGSGMWSSSTVALAAMSAASIKDLAKQLAASAQPVLVHAHLAMPPPARQAPGSGALQLPWQALLAADTMAEPASDEGSKPASTRQLRRRASRLRASTLPNAEPELGLEHGEGIRDRARTSGAGLHLPDAPQQPAWQSRPIRHCAPAAALDTGCPVIRVVHAAPLPVALRAAPGVLPMVQPLLERLLAAGMSGQAQQAAVFELYASLANERVPQCLLDVARGGLATPAKLKLAPELSAMPVVGARAWHAVQYLLLAQIQRAKQQYLARVTEWESQLAAGSSSSWPTAPELAPPQPPKPAIPWPVDVWHALIRVAAPWHGRMAAWHRQHRLSAGLHMSVPALSSDVAVLHLLLDALPFIDSAVLTAGVWESATPLLATATSGCAVPGAATQRASSSHRSGVERQLGVLQARVVDAMTEALVESHVARVQWGAHGLGVRALLRVLPLGMQHVVPALPLASAHAPAVARDADGAPLPNADLGNILALVQPDSRAAGPNDLHKPVHMSAGTAAVRAPALAAVRAMLLHYASEASARDRSSSQMASLAHWLLYHGVTRGAQPEAVAILCVEEVVQEVLTAVGARSGQQVLRQLLATCAAPWVFPTALMLSPSPLLRAAGVKLLCMALQAGILPWAELEAAGGATLLAHALSARPLCSSSVNALMGAIMGYFEAGEQEQPEGASPAPGSTPTHSASSAHARKFEEWRATDDAQIVWPQLVETLLLLAERPVNAALVAQALGELHRALLPSRAVFAIHNISMIAMRCYGWIRWWEAAALSSPASSGTPATGSWHGPIPDTHSVLSRNSSAPRLSFDATGSVDTELGEGLPSPLADTPTVLSQSGAPERGDSTVPSSPLASSVALRRDASTGAGGPARPGETLATAGDLAQPGAPVPLSSAGSSSFGRPPRTHTSLATATRRLLRTVLHAVLYKCSAVMRGGEQQARAAGDRDSADEHQRPASSRALGASGHAAYSGAVAPTGSDAPWREILKLVDRPRYQLLLLSEMLEIVTQHPAVPSANSSDTVAVLASMFQGFVQICGHSLPATLLARLVGVVNLLAVRNPPAVREQLARAGMLAMRDAAIVACLVRVRGTCDLVARTAAALEPAVGNILCGTASLDASGEPGQSADTHVTGGVGLRDPAHVPRLLAAYHAAAVGGEVDLASTLLRLLAHILAAHDDSVRAAVKLLDDPWLIASLLAAADLPPTVLDMPSSSWIPAALSWRSSATVTSAAALLRDPDTHFAQDVMELTRCWQHLYVAGSAGTASTVLGAAQSAQQPTPAKFLEVVHRIHVACENASKATARAVAKLDKAMNKAKSARRSRLMKAHTIVKGRIASSISQLKLVLSSAQQVESAAQEEHAKSQRSRLAQGRIVWHEAKQAVQPHNVPLSQGRQSSATSVPATTPSLKPSNSTDAGQYSLEALAGLPGLRTLPGKPRSRGHGSTDQASQSSRSTDPGLDVVLAWHQALHAHSQ